MIGIGVRKITAVWNRHGKVESLGENKVDEVKKEPTQGHVPYSINTMPSEPGDLQIYRERSALFTFSVLMRGKTETVGEDKTGSLR